ncbi:MAG: YybH family protein [Candidatus Acidiferrales bacterium]
MKRFLTIAAILLFIGGISPANSTTKSSKGTDALLKADSDFASATAEKGLEGFGSFLADDAATLRPNQPVISGKDSVVAAWVQLLNNHTLSITWKPMTASISASGDLGFTVGSYEITKTDDKGKQVVATGKYVTIWRKQPDGSWKVVFDTGVTDTPAEAPKSN